MGFNSGLKGLICSSPTAKVKVNVSPLYQISGDFGEQRFKIQNFSHQWMV